MAESEVWSGGYPIESNYFDTVSPWMSPARIDLSLLVDGWASPRASERFRYAELGCGTGFNLAALAALHPKADFLGVDFMPEHIARARNFAADAGLTNVRYLEASFAGLAKDAAPEPFDYVVLHGVWTWISPENRAAVVDILDRWVKPGGVVYVGYNASAGWSAASPIREIFKTVLARAGHGGLDAARDAVGTWIGQGAPEDAKVHWERIKGLPDHYLIHELASDHASSVWLSELQRDLAGAKLGYLVPADVIEQFDILRFSGASLEFVTNAAAAGWGEAARDLVAKRTFRADLFGRGVPRLKLKGVIAQFEDLTVAAWPPLLQAEKGRGQSFRNALSGDIADRIDRALSAGPMTVAAFAEATELPGQKAMQVAMIALACGDVRVLSGSETTPAYRQYMAALKRRFQHGGDVVGAASAVLGVPVNLGPDDVAALFDPDGAHDDDTIAGLRRAGFA